MAIFNGDDNPNVINGTPGSDTINGFGGDDVLDGGDGGDQLFGGQGNDVLHGGDGHQTFDGGDGVDTVTYFDRSLGGVVSLVTGTGRVGNPYASLYTLISIENSIGSNTGDDELTGNSGANILRGGGGFDLLRGGAGADTLDGGAGVDIATYYASASGVTVDLTTGIGAGGDAQGDTLAGIENVTGSNAGGDTLTGDSGFNILIGWAGADVLRGGAGNDMVAGGSGNDTLDGGVGVDTADYSADIGNVTVDLTLGIGAGGDALTDTLISIENVAGSRFKDTLTGNSGANALYGYLGDDLLRGGAGADTLDGGYGSYDFGSSLYGMDIATYSDSASGVTVDLVAGSGTGGDAQGDTLSNIEGVIGSNFNDDLTGSRLQGGGGNDLLRGRSSADKLDGGAGVDTATYYASASGVSVGLGGSLIGIENLTGSNVGGDSLTGSGGANVLSGWGGDDKLFGGAGADTLNGGIGTDYTAYADSNAAVTVNLAASTASGGTAQGDVLISIENVNGSNFNDTLTGSGVANVLRGLAGRDTLTGGAGADSFVYAAISESAVGVNADRITDFNHAQGDRIDLSLIDANGGGIGNAGLHLYRFRPLHRRGRAASLRRDKPRVTTIAGDVNGDKVSDFHIQLTGNLALVAGDFVL